MLEASSLHRTSTHFAVLCTAVAIFNPNFNSGEVIHISSLALLKVRPQYAPQSSDTNVLSDVETRTRGCAHGGHGSHAWRIRRRVHSSSHRCICHASIRHNCDRRIRGSRLPAEDGRHAETDWAVCPPYLREYTQAYQCSNLQLALKQLSAGIIPIPVLGAGYLALILILSRCVLH